MPKKNQTPKLRPRRNLAARLSAPKTSNNSAADRVSKPNSALLETLEQERRRLMKAESILGCALIAMDYDDACIASELYYPDVIEQARELVNKAIEELDSTRLRLLIEALKRDDEVSYSHPEGGLRLGGRHQIRDGESFLSPGPIHSGYVPRLSATGPLQDGWWRRHAGRSGSILLGIGGLPMAFAGWHQSKFSRLPAGG